MYRKHFGLNDLPFRNTPDEDFFYGAADRKDIVDALEYVVGRRDAIVKVTGEVGSGKTTLLRVLADRLKRRGFRIVYVPTPRLNAEEMLRFIAKDLGIEIDGYESKVDLYSKIYQYLLEAHNDSAGVVVLIDEAHTIPLDTLEEVRLLSNIETAKEKLLTIVLFGQPELDDMLARPEARQMKSRISHSFKLSPFTPSQVYEYLNFRMQKAGYVGEHVFSEQAAKLIHKVSKGLPRIVNNIADKLLLAAYARGGRKIERKDFKASGVRVVHYRGLLWWIMLLIGLIVMSWIVGKRTGLSVPQLSDTVPQSSLSGPIRQSDGSALAISDNTQEVQSAREKPSYRQGKGKQGAYLPWRPDTLLVVLATVPCDELSLARDVLNKSGIRNIKIMKFEKDGNKLCTFITGSFNKIRDAQTYIDRLPKKVKENQPYAIEVHKFNHMFSERNAEIYETE